MKSRVFRWGLYIVLIAFLLAVGFFAGRQLAPPVTALAQDDLMAIPPDMPDVPGLGSFGCPTVNNVAVFDNRIHLRCSAANGSIYYYAYESDPAHFSTANQILAIGNTAFALGKSVWMYYNSSSSLNPPGCNIDDCRGLYGVSMVP